jgi:hypothetical protein
MTTFSFSTRCVSVWAMAFVAALAAQPARADIPSPPKGTKTAPAAAAPFVVQRDTSQENSRIIIPRTLLSGGQTALAAPAATAPTGVEEDASADARLRSVNAGIMLSAVIVGGGLAVVFVRRRKARIGTLLSIGLVVSFVLIGTALADIALPGGRPNPNRTLPRPQPAAAPAVVVETTDLGNQVTLILGKNAPKLP